MVRRRSCRSLYADANCIATSGSHHRDPALKILFMKDICIFKQAAMLTLQVQAAALILRLQYPAQNWKLL